MDGGRAMNRFRLIAGLLCIITVVWLIGRDTYASWYGGSTVHVVADDLPVVLSVDGGNTRTIDAGGVTVLALERGLHTLTLTSNGITEQRAHMAEGDEHWLTAPPGRCIVEVDVSQVVYGGEHIALVPQAIYGPAAFTTKYHATGRTRSELPDRVDPGVGVVLTVLMPCKDTTDDDAVQDAMYEALRR